MKTFTVVAFMALCMLACTKPQPLSPYLFGKWEVTRIYGGFIIPPDTTYKPGNGNILQLNSDSTYVHFNSHVQNGQGVYHIRHNGFKLNQTSYDEIYFDSDTSFKSIITLNNQILTIKPLIPDISTTDYQKLGN